MDNIIIYNTDDGAAKVSLYANDGTVWMTQAQMAELFQSSKQNIGQHLNHCFNEGELEKDSVVKFFFTTAADGKKYNTAFYNLDAILSVGFRVRSPRGTEFRRWANTTLREYLQKGFLIDDERLKNPDGRPDYFDELLARIRDIRASEKRFYQKLRDLFALSVDYDKTEKKRSYFCRHPEQTHLRCHRKDRRRPHLCTCQRLRAEHGAHLLARRTSTHARYLHRQKLPLFR